MEEEEEGQVKETILKERERESATEREVEVEEEGRGISE